MVLSQILRFYPYCEKKDMISYACAASCIAVKLFEHNEEAYPDWSREVRERFGVENIEHTTWERYLDMLQNLIGATKKEVITAADFMPLAAQHLAWTERRSREVSYHIELAASVMGIYTSATPNVLAAGALMSGLSDTEKRIVYDAAVSDWDVEYCEAFMMCTLIESASGFDPFYKKLYLEEEQ